MAPTIHCVRHGQGFHNVGGGNYELPDPNLTPEGEAQCLALKDELFPDQSRISLITASPLSRALQSAFLIFEPSLGTRTSVKTILALPDAQETSDDPCDIGSDVQVLRNACQENHWPVDLSLVREGWNDKRLNSRYSPSGKAIATRARDVRLFLRQKARELVAAGDQDAHIVLVAHGGFMHYFSGDWENADLRPGTGWVNCETRAYTFEHGITDDDDDDDPDARLVELMDSRRRRGLDHPMFSDAKQRILCDQAMQAWESQGLQNPSKIGLSKDEIDAEQDFSSKAILVEA